MRRSVFHMQILFYTVILKVERSPFLSRYIQSKLTREVTYKESRKGNCQLTERHELQWHMHFYLDRINLICKKNTLSKDSLKKKRIKKYSGTRSFFNSRFFSHTPKCGLISEGISTLVPLPIKGAKSL